MPGVTARGSVGVQSMSGDYSTDGSGLFDMSAPSGWFHSLWFASVLVILLILWML